MNVKYQNVKVFSDCENPVPLEVVELVPVHQFGINTYLYNGVVYNEYLDNELQPCIKLDRPA